jgi:hypothetical protein
MDSSFIAGVNTGVVPIIQEFADVYELFKKWSKGRARKKPAGQQEWETSLHEGKIMIKGIYPTSCLSNMEHDPTPMILRASS